MTDIADIKPDTSLYSTMSDKLRALALVLEAPRAEWEFLFKKGWGPTVQIEKTAVECLLDGEEYRLKPEPPKPRELWVLYDEKGSRRGFSPGSGFPPDWKAVRFMEQL